jgi:hypothetical protein
LAARALSKSFVEAAMKAFVLSPFLVDVGEEGIEQRHVRAGLNRQVQHLILAGFRLAGSDRADTPRVHDDDAPRRMDLARELLLLLKAASAQIGDPVVQEVN